MASLFTSPKARFLVHLGHRRKDRPYRQLHLLRSLTPSSSPFALIRASPNLSGRYSLGLLPSRDQTAQTLDPQTRLNPCEPKHLPSPVESGSATSGTESTPADRVKPPQHSETLDQLRRQYPALFRTGPHRLSAAHPPPLTFQLTVSREPWPSEFLSLWEVDDSPRRFVDLFWVSLPLRPILEALKSRRPWRIFLPSRPARVSTHSANSSGRTLKDSCRSAS